MNIKKNFLFLVISLLMTFLLPNSAMASLNGLCPDGAKTHAGSRVNICYRKDDGSFVTMNISKGRLKGQKLHEGDEFLVNGKCKDSNITPTLQCPSDKIYNKTSNSCVTPTTSNVDAPTILDSNGQLLDFSAPVLLSGTAKAVNAVYKYDNVITLNGVQVDAFIKITGATNSSVTTFDRNDPNGGSPYTVSSGASVSDAKFFAPEITTTAAQGRVDFLISFQDISGNPVTLLNVYGNTIDIDGMGNIGQSEFVEYGGFVSYELASNTDLTALSGSDGIKRKFVGKGGYGGLTLNDIGRVQTKFDSISILEISMGSTWNSGLRLYGSAFVKHNLASPVTHTPPTVNTQTTTNTKPPITGGTGSSTSLSSIAVKNSTDITTTLAGSFTYPTTTTWQFTPSSPLAVGTYDVIATGNNGLVDQSDDELTILLTCTGTNVINAAGTACVAPIVCTLPDVRDPDTNTCVTSTPATCPNLSVVSATIPSYALSENGKKVTICHNTASATNPIVIDTISISALQTHIDEHSDYFTKTGSCPTDAVPCPPLVCTAPYTLNAAGNACEIQDVKPTVNTTSTNDKTPPALSGTVGTSTSLTITIKSPTPVSGAAVINATAGTWTFTPSTAIAVGVYDVEALGDSGLKDATPNELTVTASIAPTVDLKSTTEGTPIPLTGKPGSSLTISSVTLTKFEDGLGAAVIGSPTSVGSNITSGQTSWTTTTPSALIEAVGKYTITATDGNSKTGTNILNVTCPAGKVATASSCVTATNPTANDKSTTDLVPVTLNGNIGTSTTILSVTLTKTEDGSGTAVSGATPTAVAGTPLSIASGAITWTISSGAVAVGTYTITVNDGYSKTATGILTVTCPAGKVAAVSSCVTATNPAVTNKSTTDLVPVTLNGSIGTSTTISSVTLTKTRNGLGVAVSGATPTVVAGTPLSIASGTTWSISSGAVSVGTYTITITDSYSKTATGTLTVTCAVGTVATVSSCVAVTSPTVANKDTKDSVPVTLDGNIGTSTTISSVTLTKTRDGLGTAVSGATPTAVAGMPLSIASGTTTWSISSGVVSVGTYTITVTDDYPRTATGTLTVTCATGKVAASTTCNPPQPTVETQTTYDTTPVIKGTVGTSALETGEAFTVLVNGKTYVNGVDTNLKVTDTNWELTILVEISSSATPYPVVATRGTAPNATTGTGNLTITPCVLPKVVLVAVDGTSSCIDPVPTVVSQTLTTNLTVTPVIAGTVGEVALGSTETFSVTIPTTPPWIYEKEKDKADLVISPTGTTWTLTVPAEKAIPAGTYDIVVARNTTAKDKTTGDLIVNLVCLSTETNVAGVCVQTSTLPTVDSQSTADTAPTITGTVGGMVLGTTEDFTVEVNGHTYQKTELTFNGTTWSLPIQIGNALTAGQTYDVIATRNGTSRDNTSGELTITSCTKKLNKEGHCVEESLVPTVNSLNARITANSIVVTGTVGDTALGADAFSVTVSNTSHANVAGILTVSDVNWEFVITKPYYEGTFNVTATRKAISDSTNGELVITDNIAICDKSKTPHDQLIPRDSWNGSKEGTNYYLGTCTSSGEALPESPTAASLPTDPAAKVYEPVAPNALVYCDDGGVKSSADTMTGLTIKRVRIANATVTKTINLTNPIDVAINGTKSLLKLKYGVKTPAVGAMDISNATITSGNKANSVMLTGVTLTDAYIDTETDYINLDQSVNPNGSYIEVLGGNTKGTITSGMITAGTDATGNPVRGSITTGIYDGAINDNTLTKGRRIQGILKDATIENAQTTTVNGETRVDAGTVISGTISDAAVFGTVINATLTDATITNSNHCFSSGTVGSKGQLNWKEVVK